MITNAEKFMDSDLLALMRSEQFEFVPIGKFLTEHATFGLPQQRVFVAKDTAELRSWLSGMGYSPIAINTRLKSACEIELFAKSSNHFDLQSAPFLISLVAPDAIQILKYIDAYMESHPWISVGNGWGSVEFDTFFQIVYDTAAGYSESQTSLFQETTRLQQKTIDELASTNVLQRNTIELSTAQLGIKDRAIDALTSKIAELTQQIEQLKTPGKAVRTRRQRNIAN